LTNFDKCYSSPLKARPPTVPTVGPRHPITTNKRLSFITEKTVAPGQIGSIDATTTVLPPFFGLWKDEVEQEGEFS
jgi:hypothetical protein